MQMQAQLALQQETQQGILEGIRQQQEAQRQQLLQQQMINSQMFTFLSGCLGQLYRHTGLEPPPLPTSQQLQHDPVAPPPIGGFVQTPLATFPVSALLQTGMFSLPQSTGPQLTQSQPTFLEQLRQHQFSSQMSTQVSSPFSTASLVFEQTPQPSLPGPRFSSPLPSFVTPRSEGLDETDATLRSITQQINTEMASEIERTVSQGGTSATSTSSGLVTIVVSSPVPEGVPTSSRVDPVLPEGSPTASGSSSDADISGFVVQPSRVATSASPPTSPSQQD